MSARRLVRRAAICALSLAATTGAVVSASPPPPEPPLGPAAREALYRFRSYQRIFEHVTAYRARATIRNAGGRPVNIRVEAVNPDRYRVIMPGGEGVIIGGTMYMKVAGRWMPVPESFGGSLGVGQWAHARYGPRPASIVFVGHARDGGVDTDRYSFTTAPAARCELSFGRADHLPRLMECDSAGTHTHVEYYDYNANITVEHPT